MADLVPRLLVRPWKDYCLKQWEHPRVRWFLDRCAYLLLRDGAGDTLTDYKEIKQGRMELSVSSCPSFIQDQFYGAAPILREHQADERLQFAALQEKLDDHGQRKTRHTEQRETRYSRLERMRKLYPGCQMQHCRVDTDNTFMWAGKRYRIDEKLKQYGAVKTREGEYYAWDRILIVYDATGIRCFLDQEAEPIATGMVHPV